MSQTVLTDPLGNKVIFPESMCDLEKLNLDPYEIYDKPSRVIEAPAMLLMARQPVREYFYFRCIGFQNNLLLATRKVKGQWTVHMILKNPSHEIWQQIYSKSKEICVLPSIN